MSNKLTILGISASLRNARRGLGNVDLINQLNSLDSKETLNAFLEQEAFSHLENFKVAGRTEKLPFDQMYTNLKKQKGNKGLSNSEVALASALWSAKELGVEIDHLSLSEYYTESGVKNEEELVQKLLEADGIILSSPVYFGDRSSLAQTFIELIRSNDKVKHSLKGKIFAGIAVGAKRNGGQETTLIYQLMDMLNVGLLGVGNDSETTSQYGGTGLAGDVGTMAKDSYGLDTSMGTGRRIARVVQMMNLGKDYQLQGKVRVQFWILQDKDGKAVSFINKLIEPHLEKIEPIIINVFENKIVRCIACDICPTHVDVDEEYRCIIKSKKDDFKDIHPNFLNSDAIIPVVYCPEDKNGLKSNYQNFIERTRYLRRGDYVMSDIITAPIVVEEVGVREHMDIRMITSLIRHHTIVSKPIISYVQNEELLNKTKIENDFEGLIETIKEVAKGRLIIYSKESDHLKYKPVGYVLSTVKDLEDEKLKKRNEMMLSRQENVSKMKADKLIRNAK